MESQVNFSAQLIRNFLYFFLFFCSLKLSAQYIDIPKGLDNNHYSSNIKNHTETNRLGVGFPTNYSSPPSAILHVFGIDYTPLKSELKFYDTDILQTRGFVETCSPISEGNYYGIWQKGSSGNWYNIFQGKVGIGFESLGDLPEGFRTSYQLGVNGAVAIKENLTFFHTDKNLFEITLNNEHQNDVFRFKYKTPVAGITYPFLISPNSGVTVNGNLHCDNFQLVSDNQVSESVLFGDQSGNGWWEPISTITDKYWQIGEEGTLHSNVEISRIGVHTKVAPIGQFQINDRASKVAIGSVCDDKFRNGNGYIGFNAARTVTENENLWIFDYETTTKRNGGGVIWGDMGGSLYFATKPNQDITKSVDRLSDSEVMGLTRLTISPFGNVGINTHPNRDYTLAVNGKIIAEEIDVQLYDNWPDYVFNDDYQLPSLIDLEKFVLKNNHLPGVPPVDQVRKEGIKLGKMNTVLLQKVEELTLYVISLKKEIDQLKTQQSSK